MTSKRHSPLLVVGSVALDDIDGPFGRRPDILGGSASFFAAAASYYAPGAVATLPRVPLLIHAAQYSRPRPLKMPVSGLQARDARSTWHSPRSGGRRHEGIDLFAKKGTPVLSATRGEVWRIGTDALGVTAAGGSSQARGR